MSALPMLEDLLQMMMYQCQAKSLDMQEGVVYVQERSYR